MRIRAHEVQACREHCCGVDKPNLWDSLQKETPAGGADREACSVYKLPAVEGSL